MATSSYEPGDVIGPWTLVRAITGKVWIMRCSGCSRTFDRSIHSTAQRVRDGESKYGCNNCGAEMRGAREVEVMTHVNDSGRRILRRATAGTGPLPVPKRDVDTLDARVTRLETTDSVSVETQAAVIRRLEAAEDRLAELEQLRKRVAELERALEP